MPRADETKERKYTLPFSKENNESTFCFLKSFAGVISLELGGDAAGVTEHILGYLPWYLGSMGALLLSSQQDRYQKRNILYHLLFMKEIILMRAWDPGRRRKTGSMLTDIKTSESGVGSQL